MRGVFARRIRTPRTRPPCRGGPRRRPTAAAPRAYRRRGGRRTVPLPDFYVGAHAAVAGHALLTRDARRYRTYFPRLALIAP